MTKEQTKTELTAKQRAEQIRKERGGRRPMDGLNSRFPQLPERAGFRTYWFKDENGRVETALKRGWTFSERPGFTDGKFDLVKNPKKRIHIRSGTREDLSDQFSYAMDIPEDIYDEDRKAKLEVVDRREQFMKTGKVEGAGDLDVKVESDIKTNQHNFKPD
jgi:hypothetical protein